MHKEDGITKLIDGEVYYKFDYANFLYEKLQEKDDELDKYKNVIDKIKEILKEPDKDGFDEDGYDDSYYDMIYTERIKELLEEVDG